MARNAAYQTRYHNKASIYIVLLTFLVFAVVLGINCRSLNEKKERLQAEQTECSELLKQEQDRTQELQEMEKTTSTMAFIVEMAREKLGMVFDNEILFKSGD